MKITRNILVAIAVIFGLMTILAGIRVLLGANPGYIVFRPLLIFNTAMGIVYIAAGMIAWRNIKQAMYIAAAVFVLNLIVLAAIFFLKEEGHSIAVMSIRAMTLRTVVWLALFAGFGWLARNNK